jgi:hypothetical protein
MTRWEAETLLCGYEMVEATANHRSTAEDESRMNIDDETGHTGDLHNKPPEDDVQR